MRSCFLSLLQARKYKLNNMLCEVWIQGVYWSGNGDSAKNSSDKYIHFLNSAGILVVAGVKIAITPS